MRLQPPSRAVAACFTHGCSLLHLRLQGMMLYGGLALLNARNAYAHTPLHVAVSRGATRAVRSRAAYVRALPSDQVQQASESSPATICTYAYAYAYMHWA